MDNNEIISIAFSMLEFLDTYKLDSLPALAWIAWFEHGTAANRAMFKLVGRAGIIYFKSESLRLR